MNQHRTSFTFDKFTAAFNRSDDICLESMIFQIDASTNASTTRVDNPSLAPVVSSFRFSEINQ